MRIISEKSSAAVGYLLFSALATMLFALMFKDTTYLIFGIPILIAFVLAASIGDKGGADSDLAKIGWSTQKLDIALPLGVLGGIVSLLIGSIIVGKLSAGSMLVLVPDFASMGKLVSASVIPPALGTAMTIAGTWLIVAPSEEALTKVVSPIAGLSIFKNVAIAYLLSLILWALMHYPTFTLQDVDSSMYLVLAVLFVVSLAVQFISSNIMGAIVTHGTFNTGVILISQNMNVIGYYAAAIVFAVLALIYFTSRRSRT